MRSQCEPSAVQRREAERMRGVGVGTARVVAAWAGVAAVVVAVVVVAYMEVANIVDLVMGRTPMMA